MANIPTTIQLPTNIPTQDPALAGFLAQLTIALNQWILQAAIELNKRAVTGGTISISVAGLEVTPDDQLTYLITPSPTSS